MEHNKTYTENITLVEKIALMLGGMGGVHFLQLFRDFLHTFTRMLSA